MLVDVFDNAEIWHPWIGTYYQWVKSFYRLEPVFRNGYVQHPKEIPVLVIPAKINGQAAKQHNVDKPIGLCFWSEEWFAVGACVALSIELDGQAFTGKGHITCVQTEGQGYWLGVEFDPTDGFAMLMAEQICQIEHYRHDNKEILGREMSMDEAAREWVEKYAGLFSTHI